MNQSDCRCNAIQHEYTISPSDYRYHTGNEFFSIK